MEYLGFERHTGAVYEGQPDHGYRVVPPPSLSPIRFLSDGKIPQINYYYEGLATELFREDDFDPVTKLRRGRVFKFGFSQPREWHVFDPHRQALPVVKWAHGTAQEISLPTYERHYLPELKDIPAHLLPTVVIGWDPHFTFWKIVSIECNLVGTPVLSLRAKHSLGDTPELLVDKIDENLRVPLSEALGKVEASVNRLSPTEVIDRCRDTLSLAFGQMAGDRTKDLSDAINAYLRTVGGEKDIKDNLCSWCGRIVARLHSRAKPNKQAEQNLRPPSDSDADLALNCLKTVLIEFGWAR